MTQAVDELLGAFEQRFARARYVAGLLLAMADLVEAAGARGVFSGAESFLAERRDRSSHQLEVRDAQGHPVRLRGFYERWEDYFRNQNGRGGYPSSSAHAVNQWEKHTLFMDGLLALTAQQLEVVRKTVIQRVLEELPVEPPSQQHGQPVASVQDHVSLAERLVVDRMADRTLAAEVARTLPNARLDRWGYESLSELLLACATEIGAADRVDDELIWAASVDDDDPGIDEVETRAPSRLQRMRFERYRSLLDAALDVGEFTVLVGPNAAGKSNLLDGLFRAARMTRFPPRTLFRGANDPDRVRTYGQQAPFRIHVEQATGSWSWTADQGVPVVARAPFGPVVRLVLDPHRIAQPSVSARTRPRVGRDGSGVSTVLADLASTDRERFDLIVSRVSRVVPGLAAVRVPRASAGGLVGHRLEARFGEHWIPADQLSEGTLLVLALHTAVVAGGARLLLVDDLDRGLHPSAQRALLEQLLELSTQGLQVVATTHSVTVLDQVPADSVRLVAVDARGHTVVRKLTDHPRWEDWSVMLPGEFWTFIGEDWQADT